MKFTGFFYSVYTTNTSKKIIKNWTKKDEDKILKKIEDNYIVSESSKDYVTYKGDKIRYNLDDIDDRKVVIIENIS